MAPDNSRAFSCMSMQHAFPANHNRPSRGQRCWSGKGLDRVSKSQSLPVQSCKGNNASFTEVQLPNLAPASGYGGAVLQVQTLQTKEQDADKAVQSRAADQGLDYVCVLDAVVATRQLNNNGRMVDGGGKWWPKAEFGSMD